MRILKVAQTYYPYLAGGGLPTKVRAIARGLTQRGHRVTVLTTDWGPVLMTDGLKIVEQRNWGWRAAEDGVDAVYLRAWAHYRALSINPGVFRFCNRELRSFDVVHIYGLYDLLGPAVARFCRRRGIPYFVEPMGMFLPIVRSLWLKRLYLWLLGRKFIDKASCVVATSEQEFRELVKGGIRERKMIIRRNGIELPDKLTEPGQFRRQWDIPPESKVVLFLGRLVPKKSPDLLLEAFAGWLKESKGRQTPVVVLAGPAESSYKQELESLAKKLQLERYVLFPGPLYDDAKWAAYRDADIFVLPSQNENFGNTVAEALASSTPVLVTDRCGIAPLVDGRAGLVVPYDRIALQAGLGRLLEDDPMREGLRAGCQGVAHELLWDEPIGQMERLYEQNVGKRSSQLG